MAQPKSSTSSQPELEWIQMRQDFDKDKMESPRDKFLRKFKQNPLVPIGALLLLLLFWRYQLCKKIRATDTVQRDFLFSTEPPVSICATNHVTQMLFSLLRLLSDGWRAEFWSVQLQTGREEDVTDDGKVISIE